MEKHFTIDELAALTGKTRGALAQMRYLGSGPRFVKMGRTVLYPASGLEDYFRAHSRTQTGRSA